MPDNNPKDPKDLPRVPHATEHGLQEGRPHPALRKYQAEYKVVDIAEAMKLMGLRRSGEIPRIKGGLDDNSPDMEIKGAVLPDPYVKQHIDPKAKDGIKPKKAEVTRESVMRMKPGTVESMVDENAFDEIPPDAVMPSDMRFREKKPEPVKTEMAGNVVEKVVYEKDERSLKKIAELELRLSSYENYLNGRTRIEVQMENLSFGISAVDVIESMYGIVVLLPMNGDSMTFTPAPLSHAVISCQSKSVFSDVIYTGTSFELPQFGLFGLSFTKKPKDGKGTMSEFVESVKNS